MQWLAIVVLLFHSHIDPWRREWYVRTHEVIEAH